jgi:hypothetical protein
MRESLNRRDGPRRELVGLAGERGMEDRGHRAVGDHPSGLLPQKLNRYLNCTALLPVNLPGFFNNLERRLGELVPLGNIEALDPF